MCVKRVIRVITCQVKRRRPLLLVYLLSLVVGILYTYSNDVLHGYNKTYYAVYVTTPPPTTLPPPPVPYVYVITPTYTRPMQKAELTRLSQALLLVQNLHWIVVEDATNRTALVANLLQRSMLNFTHLHARTVPHASHRGVAQRNAALAWIRANVRDGGVVYFADDDNTYDKQLFEEMRDTETVSIWPVGFIAGRSYEGPICKDNNVTGFRTKFAPDRQFPIDMAGFAINVQLFLMHPEANFDIKSKGGYLETNLLSSLRVTRDLLQPRADMCSKVLVWHTKSNPPSMPRENRSSFPFIEV